MTPVVIVVLTFCVAMAILGTVGIFVPTALLAVSRPFLTPAGLYAAAAIRLVLGTALFLAAPTSRAPKTLRILGIGIIVAGVITPLLGVERARAIVVGGAGDRVHASGVNRTGLADG